MNHIDEVIKLMRLAKEKNPVVDFLTNYVTANDLTSVTAFFGGSPVMTDDPVDAEDVVIHGNADALVYNIGTITEKYVEAMLEAGRAAKQRNIPIVLDPVAMAATPFRNRSVNQMLEELNITIIKGNLGEIKSCLGIKINSKGVDSNESEEGAEEFCIRLARERGVVVAMTGKEDIITDGQRLVKIKNGTPRLPKVIGTGCMIGAMIATFSGATKDYFYSALAGVILMGIAGEIAEEKIAPEHGHVIFKQQLLDTLSVLTEKQVRDKANIVEIM